MVIDRIEVLDDVKVDLGDFSLLLPAANDAEDVLREGCM